MKNRRNIIIAFLLCACLIVGVGYAAVGDVLDVDGTAELGLESERNFDSNIYFTDAKAFQSGDSASTTPTNPDKVTFSVTSVTGDDTTAFFKFTFVNKNTEAVTVYLSNFLTSERILDKETGNAQQTVENNRIYSVKFSICDKKHASEAEISSQGHHLHDAQEGVHNFTGDTHDNGAFAVNGGATAYLYVAVSLNSDYDANGEVDGIQILAPNATVSANFGLEFSIWDAVVTEGEGN